MSDEKKDWSTLAALAKAVEGHLPVRLFNADAGVVGLRDRNGVCLLDMQTPVRAPGQFIAFDRYVRDAVNDVPVLLEEVRRLRAEITGAQSDGHQPEVMCPHGLPVRAVCAACGNFTMRGDRSDKESHEDTMQPAARQEFEAALSALETWHDDGLCPICWDDVAAKGGHGQVWAEELQGNIDCPVGAIRKLTREAQDKAPPDLAALKLAEKAEDRESLRRFVRAFNEGVDACIAALAQRPAKERTPIPGSPGGGYFCDHKIECKTFEEHLQRAPERSAEAAPWSDVWECEVCGARRETTRPEGEWCANGHEPKLLGKRLRSNEVPAEFRKANHAEPGRFREPQPFEVVCPVCSAPIGQHCHVKGGGDDGLDMGPVTTHLGRTRAWYEANPERPASRPRPDHRWSRVLDIADVIEGELGDELAMIARRALSAPGPNARPRPETEMPNVARIAVLEEIAKAAKPMVRNWPEQGCLHEDNVRLVQALNSLRDLDEKGDPT